jgi:hypothetical protein
VVRDLVAAGDRRRRQRAVAKTLARTAPVAAAGVLLVGLLTSPECDAVLMASTELRSTCVQLFGRHDCKGADMM